MALREGKEGGRWLGKGRPCCRRRRRRRLFRRETQDSKRREEWARGAGGETGIVGSDEEESVGGCLAAVGGQPVGLCRVYMTAEKRRVITGSGVIGER
jgi:hypothetical protein